jgi:hypothetical protein
VAPCFGESKSSGVASRLEDPVRGTGKGPFQGIKIKGRSLFMVVLDMALDIRSKYPVMFMSERFIFI